MLCLYLMSLFRNAFENISHGRTRTVMRLTCAFVLLIVTAMYNFSHNDNKSLDNPRVALYRSFPLFRIFLQCSLY
uniref:Uncharacterized protein n=1 Tax=Pararge aegeria TaxID=116150 RepID=S4PLH4_9NEOP